MNSYFHEKAPKIAFRILIVKNLQNIKDHMHWAVIDHKKGSSPAPEIRRPHGFPASLKPAAIDLECQIQAKI
jgi:hypothetical protein